MNSKKTYIKQTINLFWKHSLREWKSLAILLIGVTLGKISTAVATLYYKEFIDGLLLENPSFEYLMSIVWMIMFWYFWEFVGWRILEIFITFYQPSVMKSLLDMTYDYVQQHSYRFFSDSFGGSLLKQINRLPSSFERVTDKILLSVYPIFIQIIATIVVLGQVSWLLSGILSIWLVFYTTANYYFTKFKLQFDIIKNKAESKVSGYVADTITNNINIKLFSSHSYEYIQLQKLSEQWKKMIMKSWNYSNIANAIQNALMILMEFILLYVGLILWEKGEMTVGDFVLLQSLVLMLFIDIWDFGRHLRELGRGLADAEEIMEILSTPHEILDHSSGILSVSKGLILCDQVCFGYEKNMSVFQNFSLDIQPGEKVAFVSRSGEGKSTLIKLLLRLFDINSGKILIDGQDISMVFQDSLRKNIALVPQDPILFHRTIAENIAYGRSNATEQEIISAAKQAHCHEFILELSHGYETLVGERGIKLSGGQRQRVAIARAILKDAPILILDEATSSLDSESEQLIQTALTDLMQGRTTLVIAHRLSTVMQMDRIIVLENGQIKEQGSHEELLNTPTSLYKKLWELQVGFY